MIPIVFDRSALIHHRNRAAKRLHDYDFLIREVGERVADRLNDTHRQFASVLIIGSHTGQLAGMLAAQPSIGHIVQADISETMLKHSSGARVVMDDEMLGFAPESFDLIISNLSLHWVNDVPGALIQLRQCLKTDGIVFATLWGTQTLHELRHSILTAEAERGLSPRVSPFIDVKDAGMLLQRAGFSMPVADSERITVEYPHAMRLMEDIRGMGESNTVSKRRKNFTSRRSLMAITEQYQQLFPSTDQGICATFELVTMTGMRV